MGPSSWHANGLRSRDKMLVGGNRFPSGCLVDQRHGAASKFPDEFSK